MFIPKILLYGEKNLFLSQICQRPFELVGQIKFFGEVDGQKFNLFRNGKFSINDKLHDHKDLLPILRGSNYVVFTDCFELKSLKDFFMKIGYSRSQVVSLREFINLPTDDFYDVNSDHHLMYFLKSNAIKSLLDVDAHFAKSQLLTKGINDVTEIDCVCKEKMLPIKENIYTHIYKKFSDCRFRHYDAALLYGKTGLDFTIEFSKLEGITDLIITFATYGSDFEKYIELTKKNYESVNFVPSFAGKWLFIHRHKTLKNFTMYVVTHKQLPQDYVEKIPEGYKMIHAGRAISDDFEYLGDNTGENISRLNPYINELTALYWMWKNTDHSIIGFSHYRRFFTESEEKPFTKINDENFSHEKILTLEKAEKLLDDCDVIVTRLALHYTTQFEDIANDVGFELATLVMSVMKKNLLKLCPDYEETFDYVVNSPTYYECHIFITRKNVFQSYCKWLFSFVLDTLNEVMKQVPLEKIPGKQKRAVGYFAERMFTVWLLKNHLRIKELNKMMDIEI